MERRTAWQKWLKRAVIGCGLCAALAIIAYIYLLHCFAQITKPDPELYRIQPLYYAVQQGDTSQSVIARIGPPASSPETATSDTMKLRYSISGFAFTYGFLFYFDHEGKLTEKRFLH